jgi:hypothetical protein
MKKATILYDAMDNRFVISLIGIPISTVCGFGKTPEEALYSLNKLLSPFNPILREEIEVDPLCINDTDLTEDFNKFFAGPEE